MRADSHVLAGTHSPDMYALKSFSAMFNDSAVRFSINDTAQHCNIRNNRSRQQQGYKRLCKTKRLIYKFKKSHQVGKVIPSLAGHQSTSIAKPRNEVDVALESRGIGLQHDEDESWEELIGGRRSIDGLLQQ